MTQKKIIFLCIAGALATIIMSLWFFSKPKVTPPPLSPPLPASATTTPVAPPAQPSSTNGMKTYTNNEYRFAFQYPGDWIIENNSFGGYYSKFLLMVAPKIGQKTYFPVYVHVVLPIFADQTFLRANPVTSTVTIGGVLGIKYENEFEGVPEVAIVLPLEQYKIIVGTTDRQDYEDVFNQILASFKFLK